ncbi:MAG TPA: crosslink repair DNA glycosylase YcaQ family protein [Gaiellaceae bacterium]|nr:crosslink repair DNA glycosylase YcaQ family protein [Gaiellaceae bacterium]
MSAAELERLRRVAVRAAVLDGSAKTVLETVRRLGFLQLDPISTVAPAQELVLWSRFGSRYDPAELERLLWKQRKLVEWNAYVYPAEDLPALKALMRRRDRPLDLRVIAWLKEHASYRRYVLRELEQRGPLLSREIEDHANLIREGHRWWGERKMGLMLGMLNMRGEVAVVGRQGKQRIWDLAERWYPETDRVPLAEAKRHLAARRQRRLGAWLERGKWHVHPEADDSPVPDRATLLTPFDQLIHDRARTKALWDFYYRIEIYVPAAKREFGYYVLPLLVGDRIVGRAEPIYDRKAGRLSLRGAWGDTSRLDEAMDDLAAWLGAHRV